MAETKPVAIAAPWSQATAIFSGGKELGIPLAVLGIVIALITPMPSFMLDGLIVLDIMTSVIVLMVAVHIKKAVEFSIFPTTLLLLTLFRLALNISSTRLILMNGNTGTSAAGNVIQAFGNFVVGGNYIIGAVIFLVLIAIQYVVINHGAVRISEVTARFTLDALPGKQMSIDSDLSSGLIDEKEARLRRRNLAKEAEFYGAMDGASRFTQRDAVASILITGINIIAGFLIGVLQHGMDLGHAIETYTVLTIGDGLVTVIPALMISISGGLIVTRANSDDDLGSDVTKQLFGAAQPLLLASGVLILLALFPGLPTIPFMGVGVALGYLALQMQKKQKAAATVESAAKPAAAKEDLESLLRVEPLSVELGLGLVRYVAGGANSPFLRRIAGIRRQLASETGFLLGPVRVVDNVALKAHEYVILLKGAEIGRSELPAGCELAIPVSKDSPPPSGRQTKEPAFGMTGWWIPAEQADACRRKGFTVVDGVSVMGTHLSELIRRHAAELFFRQDAKRFLDRVSAEHPKVVEDLVPKVLPLVVVQRVLQNLLRERVSIRDAVTILEAMGEATATIRNPMLISEYVRQSLRRVVVKPYLNAQGDLPAWMIDPALEQMVEAAAEHGEQNSHLTLKPAVIRDILQRISQKVGEPGAPIVAITGSGSRYFFRQIVESSIRNLFFISHNEIPSEVKVVSMGVIQ
ncbi:MAG TPA: flagellar biosynthesis protein FlhA [Bryobacteraceae bacterium]|jgi:flagellar biosynthesis protein FlhA|nr:flagellar biosynthesis protein FlhA [Bryobacteraceae bacterium]